MIEPGMFDMIMRLRSHGISDNRVLGAMELVRRSHFVPKEYISQSYDECSLPVDCGQSLPAPLTLAIILQTLNARPDDKVLLIGSGTGYLAAVLAHLSKRVYGIDRYNKLVELAEEKLKKQAANVVLRHGDGYYGWKGQAPFGRIILSVSVKTLPKPLLEQLSDNGKIVFVKNGMLISATKSKTKTGMTKTGMTKTGWEFTEKEIMKLELPAIQKGKSKSL